MKSYLEALINYAVDRGLIEQEDKTYAFNRLLEQMELDSVDEEEPVSAPLNEILDALCDDACRRGLIENNIVSRDLFDTKLMGVLTPFPHEVRQKFFTLYAESPEKATNWYYQFSQDTNYIRRDRIKKDKKWTYDCEYGSIDITINLSKPEKDPRAIAAARNAPQTDYPKCQLCSENEGYAGRLNHPARQNHRLIPVTIADSPWYMQYSPYVYYNEHCIVLNSQHTPMKIDRACFCKLFDFVKQFPHYFVGSNADLPIVGGSILSHDHFQGGNYEFAMAKAPVETSLVFSGFPDVKAGIVRWPMSVIRLSCPDSQRIIQLADKILSAWRAYSDPSVSIYAETEGTPHNTITPIARKRGENYELDLVLRNNLTTEEHPLGLFHPHAKLHHIKKENIGLIEVMGLAILPSRLKTELAGLKQAILDQTDIRADEALAVHGDWVDELREKYRFTPENTEDILCREVGAVFQQVLEDAGVFKRDSIGQNAFLRFIESVNKK